MSKPRWLLGLVFLVAVPLQAQQFGAWAAVDGDEIMITELESLTDPATIHVYERSGDGWTETGSLQLPPIPGHEAGGGDYFGRFVIRDGETLLIGSTAIDMDADGQSDGGVLVYRRSGDEWTFDTLLRPESVPMGVSFGRFAAMGDDHLFVTALGDNESRGGVWVFERDGRGGWRESGKITPGPDAPALEFFGWGLDFDGERLIAGAVQNYQNGWGAARIFSRDGSGAWVEEAELTPDSLYRQAAYGQTVGWLDGRALVSALFADQGRGAVFVYDRDEMTGEWTQSLMLTAPDRQQGAVFGQTIEVVGDEVWIGAPGADGAGRVYRFAYDPDTGRFGDVHKLAGLEQEPGDSFGTFVAAGDGVAIVSQLGDDFGLGSAIVLARSGEEWSPEQKLLGPDPAALPAIAGGEVECGDDGMADQFTCSNVEILSFLPVSAIGGGRGSQTNDVWGWTDPQTNREYALVGRRDGTSFVDVTDPVNPVFLGDLPKTPGSRGNTWRDIKVYEDHAYIVADGAGDHGMQVFDLTRLRDVTSPPVTFEPDQLYEGIASAHNIVINEASGTAYAVGSNSGGETCGGGLHMIDIHDADRPTFIGCFQDTETGIAGTGYSHDAMCIMYDGPDTEHVGREICFGSNENALSIADVTDKRNPVKLSSAAYPNVAYAHQGWITEDHRYFFMNDEGDENAAQNDSTIDMPGTRTLVWDVADLDDPVMIKEHFGETLTIDHNLYIVDDLMYQSNYVSGLRILDISDPENPEEVGFLDTVPWDESITFDGSWSNYPFFESGTIVVTSGKEGVFFVRYRRPELVP